MRMTRTSVLVATALTLGSLMSITAQSQNAAAAATTPTYVREFIVDSAYAIPTGSLFVAPSGNDAAAGTQTAPLRTISRALSVATSGKTIVLRGGTYRESLGTIKLPVVLQAYPHEQVWLKGSTVVSGFTANGALFTKPWTSTICKNCYPTAAIDPAYPAAGSPEQVFIDGLPQQEVLSASHVTPGTFFMDTSGSQLWLGTNPAGRTVEVTKHETAMTFSNNAPNSALKGIGVAHYGAHFNFNMPGMITSDASGVIFDRVTVSWSAGRGLSIASDNNVVSYSRFLNNGLNGLHSNGSHGLRVVSNRISYSNYERFSIVPSPTASVAAMKITGSTGLSVTKNIVSDNTSNGIWFDASSASSTIANNIATRNAGHGIAVEVSGRIIVAGNTSVLNGRDGIKVSGANNVDVYNNTVAHNSWSQLGVYDDARQNPSAEILALGITWDTAYVRVYNNVFIASTNSTRAPFNSFDLTSPRHLTLANMISGQNSNLWGRTSITTALQYLATVQPTLTTSARYTNLAALQAGTGRDTASKSADNLSLTTLFASPSTGLWTLTASAPVVTMTALPSTVATALGVTTATKPGQLSAPTA